MERKKTYWPVAVLALVAVAFFVQEASGKSGARAGKVTYIRGWAGVIREDGQNPLELQKGAQLNWGDTVVTGKKRCRIEIRLDDGSVVRLASNTSFKIEKGRFAHGQRQFSAKLMKGKFYAVVAKLKGAKSEFKVRTSSAVAGVRGTTFRIDAKRDRSTVVRVYSGAVAVSNAPLYTKPTAPAGKKEPKLPQRRGVKPGGPHRVEVAGPQEVTRKQWEELVAKAMQEIRVSADGKLSEPVAFDPKADAADEWVAWNKSRDAALGAE